MTDIDFEMMDRKMKLEQNPKSKPIRLIIFFTLIIIAIMITIFAYENSHKQSSKENYDRLMYAFINFTNYKSFKLTFERKLFLDDEENSYDTIYELYKKNSDYRLNVTLGDGKTNYDAGGIYLNSSYIELLFSDDESVFCTYKKVLDVIETYAPSLSEVTNDLSKIEYEKYTNYIYQEVTRFAQDINYESYYDLIKLYIGDKITNEGNEQIVIDNKTIDTDKFLVVISNKEKNDMNIALLDAIKNDSQFSSFVTSLTNGLLDIFYNSRDYEKIRMTKDEFLSNRDEYEKVICDTLDSYIETFKTFLINSNDGISEDENEYYYYYLTNDNRIVKAESLSLTMQNDQKYFAKEYYTLEKTNSLSQSIIKPNPSARINLASKSRSELYSYVDVINSKYNKLFNDLFNSIINDNLNIDDNIDDNITE